MRDDVNAEGCPSIGDFIELFSPSVLDLNRG